MSDCANTTPANWCSAKVNPASAPAEVTFEQDEVPLYETSFKLSWDGSTYLDFVSDADLDAFRLKISDGEFTTHGILNLSSGGDDDGQGTIYSPNGTIPITGGTGADIARFYVQERRLRAPRLYMGEHAELLWPIINEHSEEIHPVFKSASTTDLLLLKNGASTTRFRFGMDAEGNPQLDLIHSSQSWRVQAGYGAAGSATQADFVLKTPAGANLLVVESEGHVTVKKHISPGAYLVTGCNAAGVPGSPPAEGCLFVDADTEELWVSVDDGGLTWMKAVLT